ncbi:NB-ARC domains-containing protein [Artemisia annua]|uniref:NB-ARC domains-containing protein n=1 Tax=Artemisia annua TaxID=35608 RepID=A0A2U1PH55_ARTAN|nr:NB-ARC domains-containing protein [Artemisia annua]
MKVVDIGMEKEVREEVLNKYRYMSFVHETNITCKKFKAFDTTNNLRTFLAVPIVGKCLWNMLPLGIGELKGLQILSNIIVGENDDFPISGLRNLKNLQGKIYICGLEQVKSARDIREVKLSQKMVSELELEWRDVFDDSRNETLENEKLYVSTTIGNLPSLKMLFIKDLDEVKDVGSEFVGDGSGPALPSLESLCFEDMKGWRRGQLLLVVLWCSVSMPSRDYIKKLILIGVASSVSKLSIEGISGLTDEEWRDVMEHLGAVEEVTIESKASNVLVNLRKLEVWFCEELVSLGEKEEPKTIAINILTDLMTVDFHQSRSAFTPDAIRVEAHVQKHTVSLKLQMSGKEPVSITANSEIYDQRWGDNTGDSQGLTRDNKGVERISGVVIKKDVLKVKSVSGNEELLMLKGELQWVAKSIEKSVLIRDLKMFQYVFKVPEPPEPLPTEPVPEHY